jgi:hypothetical protein
MAAPPPFGRDLFHCEEPSLSWDCRFCPRIRVYEGGRPGIAENCATCQTCGCLTVGAEDLTTIAALIDLHLI